MEQGIHVLVGRSAFKAIRTLRMTRPHESSEMFGAIELPERRAWLPPDDPETRTHDNAPSDNELLSALPHSWEETLADVAFPFGRAIVNKRISPGHLEESIRHTAEDPLELGVFSKQVSVQRKTVKSRVLSRDLPSGALIALDHDTYIASPELTCIHLAQTASAAELALRIMELTGYWTLPPHPSSPETSDIYGAQPVTTVARIRAMASLVPRIYGRATLNRALDLAVEGTASPPEAALALMFEMPLSKGGYGMEKPLANARVYPPEALEPYLGQTSYYTDVFFPSLFADLEYESDAFHFDPYLHYIAYADGTDGASAAFANKLAEDRRRARDLQAMGLHVIPVTAQDLASRVSLDHVAAALAAHADKLHALDAAEYMSELESRECVQARDVLYGEIRTALA